MTPYDLQTFLESAPMPPPLAEPCPRRGAHRVYQFREAETVPRRWQSWTLLRGKYVEVRACLACWRVWRI